MQKTLISLILAPLCLVLAANAQLKPSYFPQDTEWMLQFDFKALCESPVLRLIESVMDEDASRKLAALQAMYGVNLTNDLDTVVLCGKGGMQDGGGVLYACGRFDVKRLTALAGGAKEYSNAVIGEHSLISWTDNGKRNHACFIDPTLVVMSQDEAMAKQAVELIGGKAGGLAPDGFAKTLERRKGRFAALQSNKLSQLASVNPQLAAMLGQAEALQLELGQLDDGKGLKLSLAVKSPNAEQAQQLSQTVLGLKALVMMQAQQQPEAAKLAQNIDVAQQDTYVSLNMKLPEDMLRQLIAAQAGKPKDTKQGQPARPDF